MRYLLTIAYQGTHYCGWQVQPNGDTIQGKLMEAGSHFIKSDFTIQGASRTDAGVHALGQRAVLDTEQVFKPHRLIGAFNAYLPKDIVILKVEQADPDFHPRYDAIKKTYTYDIQTGQVALPFEREKSWHIKEELDLLKMKEGIQYIIGEHDFKSFCSVNTAVLSTVRHIYALRIEETTFGIRFTIEGNGFLYNMVRIIVGTFVNIGLGKIEPDEIPVIIKAVNRTAAGPTAPAHGLTLYKIEYNKETQHD